MDSIRYNRIIRAPLLAAALLAAAFGCSEDSKSPVESDPTPALATAATLFFTQVSAGSNHTCGITSEKKAYCWGDNYEGQLGTGTTLVSSSKPVAVAGGLRFLQISAGAEFTCAIATTNKAYCWGNNGSGNLGTGGGSSRSPVAVAGGRSFRMVRAGYEHTCAVTLWDAGFCWGKNRFGQLGNNSTVSYSQTPVRVAGGLPWNRIVAGGHYSCGVTTDNKAYCWGHNGYGQLGDGTHTLRRRPVAVATGLRFRLIVAGGGAYEDMQQESPEVAHTCAVTTDNKGYCWGWVEGATTITDTPTPIPGTSRRWQQVIAGWRHTCGVTTADVAFCWGNNETGQNGTGTITGSSAPVRVTGGQVFTAVTTGVGGQVSYGVGGVHSCGLTSGNRVYCWGSNEWGQLGDGTRERRLSPVAVVGP